MLAEFIKSFQIQLINLLPIPHYTPTFTYHYSIAEAAIGGAGGPWSPLSEGWPPSGGLVSRTRNVRFHSFTFKYIRPNSSTVFQ